MAEPQSHTLVTGASGFIGRALMAALATQRPVVCLSRRKLADLPERVAQIVGEFHSFEDLRGLDGYNLDAAVHLAAVTGGCSEEDGLAVNVQGTRRLLRYLIDRGCAKFVLASSVAAVGCLDNDFVPLQLPMADTHPCLARDAYGLSKAMMEDVTRYLQRKHPATEFINLRLGGVVDDDAWTPTTFTTAEPPPYPFVLLARVMRSDVVSALLAALTAPPRPGVHVYNVVGPTTACAEAVPVQLRAGLGEKIGGLDLSWYQQPGHANDALYSLEKIKLELGWTPLKPTG